MGLVDEAAAAAVNKGMELFAYSIGDSMVNLNGNGTLNATARQEAPGMIFKMISYTVDPFQMQFVKDWWGTSLVFFVVIAALYILAGGGFALLQTLAPETARSISWLENGTGNAFEVKKWMNNILLSLVFPFLTYFGLYTILQMCYVVTALVTQQALNAVPPTAENMITYLFMALTFLVLSVVMSIRSIVIVLFCAGGLMLAALYLIPSLQTLVKHIFTYFLLLVCLFHPSRLRLSRFKLRYTSRLWFCS
jgi:hypothetical protein